MASFEQIAMVSAVMGTLALCVFTFIMPMNTVSGYHHDASLSSSQFAAIIGNSTAAGSSVNQTIYTLSTYQNRNDPVIIFSLLSLLATTVGAMLILTLSMPAMLICMAAVILSIIGAFIDISLLWPIVGTLIGTLVIWAIGRIFGLWGNR